MARDMAKKAVSDARYDAKTYDQISVKFRKNSQEFSSLMKASEDSQVSMAEYVRISVSEKLDRYEDGQNG